ncbi:MAG: hypothetical protein KGI54_17505 [Pseudomonadota bacterium]|nr:hypothetical protein [Pseudomonadota bacterium]
MPNLRESVAAALNSSLDSDDLHERPVDRLGAFSKSERIGTLLWRVKYDNDAKSYKPALLLLTRLFRKQKESRNFIHSICKCVLDEWLMDKCRHCGGNGQVIQAQTLVQCSSCNGTGIHRFKDRERARALKMNLDQVEKLNKRLGQIHDYLGDIDRKVNVKTNIELEKWKDYEN